MVEFAEMLALINEPNTTPLRRAEIGRVLNDFGDTRRGVALRDDDIPDIEWVEIPASDFVEGNGETCFLPTFYIARYPITYIQFQAFIDASDGYHYEKWWEDFSQRKSTEPGQQEWQFPNHPRENVSWYDAMAFCRWLSEKLNCEIRLPHEEEWGKAARGMDARKYPWGNEYRVGYANINESNADPRYGIEAVGPYYLEQTCAVGLYPQGNSPYGVCDMSGNVHDWCLDKSGIDYEEDRYLMCGGAFSFPAYCQTTSAAWAISADAKSSEIGFRVLCENRP